MGAVANLVLVLDLLCFLSTFFLPWDKSRTHWRMLELIGVGVFVLCLLALVALIGSIARGRKGLAGWSLFAFLVSVLLVIFIVWASGIRDLFTVSTERLGGSSDSVPHLSTQAPGLKKP